MRTILSYPISIFVTIGILYLSFAPSSTFEFAEGVSRFPHADKVVHFIMFFVLTAVLIYESVIRKKIAYPSRKFWIICIIFPIVLGGIIEILQGAFFNRSACWFDWLADIAGVLVAVFLFKNSKISRFKNF
jgi:VanZ family protein